MRFRLSQIICRTCLNELRIAEKLCPVDARIYSLQAKCYYLLEHPGTEGVIKKAIKHS